MKEKNQKNKSPPSPHNIHPSPKAQKGPVRPSKAHPLNTNPPTPTP